MLYIVGGLIVLAAIIAAIVLVFRLIFDLKKPEDIIAKNKGNEAAQSVWVKKYPEADLRQYASTFALFGLVFSLALTITAFEWTTYERTTMDLGAIVLDDDFEIEPPQTKFEKPPPPPPPPPEITVVEDEEILEDEPEIVIEEIEEDTKIEIPIIEAEPEKEEETIFTIVEDMPSFPGGEAALMKYLASIPYPPMAKENDIEGSVFVRFVVDKDGSVTNVEVVRGADKILNDAAVNHIKKMPKWTPGKQRGKPVKVQYVLPIRFKLS